VKYYAWFVQDDWRVNDRLTVNYGVRLEHETGLAEKDNQMVVGSIRAAVEPAQRDHPRRSGRRHDGASGNGRLALRRPERRQDQTGNVAGPQDLAAYRLAYSAQRQTVRSRRLRLFWARGSPA
jgi:outer membrane receptor protein involved in Fe transport